ncbi:hypothetical protein HMPREF1248_1375 [Coriobacteriaceae bacterium BV3Ac1]|nr:hypothetical protein HMPREF1248_1375 [Coriobacteriaceae bacterium BV3Ac1]
MCLMQGKTPTYCVDCEQETLKVHSNYDYLFQKLFSHTLCLRIPMAHT